MVDKNHRAYNFSAGPSCLPLRVLQKTQESLLNWNGCGESVMEMSHRGKNFISIYRKMVADAREILRIPDTHEVLILHGGATQMFAAVPQNVLGESCDSKTLYAITGTWSEKALAEGNKYSKATIACDAAATGGGHYRHIPSLETWHMPNDAKYLHYCANETVNGVEFSFVPKPNNDIPLISDMSSNICSKPVDVSAHQIIYAGLQKNLGPAGAALVIIDKACLANKPRSTCPAVMDFTLAAKNESMYNTPNCWSIYVTGLVLQDLKEQGGLEAVADRNEYKARLLYSFIDNSDGYFSCPVLQAFRSRMNVPFRVGYENPTLEAKFVSDAARVANLTNLAGHRSVGGCRASLYNAMPIEGVEKLVDFMTMFMQENPVEILTKPTDIHQAI